MTNEEKFAAIVERLKAEGWIDDPTIISVMVIIDYLDKLEKMKLIECAFNMTPVGSKIADICHEFMWLPSDLDIRRFVDDMVDEVDRIGFSYMIKRFRDDKEGLIEEVKKFRSEK